MRDRLLGRDGGDEDYVVLGETPASMEARGYIAVGKDFPVFLHPQTRAEHALARTERKTAAGYRGFVVSTDPSVTLEEDLRRRDLTINAIAQAEDGRLIDPYGGVADLHGRWLRHVSEAFAEDPVRILRLARFSARFAPLGFRVAPETLALCKAMVASGEVDALVAERVWAECVRALAEPQPSAFIALLRQCGALQRVMPEVDALFGVPQRAEFHPEIDCGVHTLMVMDACARMRPGDSIAGFAALTHDLGKALTPKDQWPRHLQHEQQGLVPLAALCARLKVPNHYRAAAELACKAHLQVHRADELRPGTMLELVESAGAIRDLESLERLLVVCAADKSGRLGAALAAHEHAARIRIAASAARAVQARDLPPMPPGPQVGEALRRARINAVAVALRRLDARA